jgi:Flp pilus assembly protein TadD
MIQALRDARLAPTETLVDTLGAELTEIRASLGNPGAASAAEARLGQLARVHARDPRVHQCLGELATRAHRYRDAVAAFLKALELAPKDALLHWNLALAYQGAGEKRAAAKALEAAMSLDLDPSLKRHAAVLHRALKGQP